MANDNKPTKEELKAIENAAIEEAEKLEKNPPVDVTPEEEQPIEEPEKVDEKEVDPSKELYKKKFSESSREAQKIAAKNRVINKALQEADEIPEPTEEEMQSIYKNDWDVMSDIDKDLAKETIISKKWRAKIKEASNQATKIEKWNESVEEYILDPKTLVDNPELEGKKEAFVEYATEEKHNNIPFDVLVPAFLQKQSTLKKQNKGQMFERALGGSNEKPTPKSNKIPLIEARKLRETDYNTYKQYLKEGKIESDL